MDSFSGSVMIALLPTRSEWCRIEMPHMTLVFAGEMKDLKPTVFNELAKDAASIAMLASPVVLRVMGVEVFGDVDKVDVMRLQPSSELLAMRRSVDRWNKSEFPFNPHVTIGPTGSSINTDLPTYIAFNRIAVGWGDDILTFWLRSMSSSPSIA